MEIENKHIEGLIYSYLMGDISEEGRNELLQWLETDDAHMRHLSEMADCWATAHVPLFAAGMKADFRKHFGTLADPVTPSPKNHWLNFRFLAKVAASVLILLSVGTASYYIGMRHDQPNSSILAYFETTTPMGAQTKVVLPDQSVVWLNAGSTLRYGSDFNRDGRSVQLDGEAYFEVTRDSLKPFIVRSEKLDIKVLGTSFNVKAYGVDEMTDVTLVSGKVNVSLRDEVVHAGDVTLTPNRKLSFNKETNKVRVSEVNAKAALSWMDGNLKFSEQPFMSIAKDLERKFNVRIRIESDPLRKEIFSGSFTRDYSLDQILREVDVEGKYVWTRSGDEIIIKDK
ncbi:MAG: FecR domain-containing protein [Parabacteroides sp.]|nr:FecR domain-containing protein [Parabacteroides sp.]